MKSFGFVHSQRKSPLLQHPPMVTKFLHVYPSSLKIPFQLNKVSTSSIQLTNVSNHNVAFKVKTTRPRKYCVRPNVGIISPGSTCVVRVSMQAQTEVPAHRTSKDKFLVQSAIAPTGLCVENISHMIRRGSGNTIEEYKLMVVLISANPPSPIPEGSEDSSSSDPSELEYAVHQNHCMILMNDVRGKACGKAEENYFGKFQIPEASSLVNDHKMSLDWAAMSELIEERTLAILQNQKLNHELDMLRKQIDEGRRSIASILFLIMSGVLGFFLGCVVSSSSC